MFVETIHDLNIRNLQCVYQVHYTDMTGTSIFWKENTTVKRMPCIKDMDRTNWAMHWAGFQSDAPVTALVVWCPVSEDATHVMKSNDAIRTISCREQVISKRCEAAELYWYESAEGMYFPELDVLEERVIDLYLMPTNMQTLRQNLDILNQYFSKHNTINVMMLTPSNTDAKKEFMQEFSKNYSALEFPHKVTLL